MHRFYADERGVMGDRAYLAPEDARHARSVLRMKPGDGFQLLCDGARYAAVLTELSAEEAVCRIGERLPSTEAALRVTLYQGLPKADKMEWIVQKAVELGVHRIVPVRMSRCVVQLDARDGEKKRERWQKIAREAAKQSGRCLMPEVSAPVSFPALCTALSAHEAALVPWEDAAGYSLSGFHAEQPDTRDVAVVIGPEGGMSEDEVAAMRTAGCRAVTLGPRILRTETAGLAAVSALMCLFGEME